MGTGRLPLRDRLLPAVPQPRLSKAFHQAFDDVGFPPLLKLRSRFGGEVRAQRQQLMKGSAGRWKFSELAVCGCERQVRAPELGHLDLSGDLQGRAVVAQA